MHVTPTELHVVKRGSLGLRFCVLGPVAAVLAELPASGSLDTTLEEPCTEPHWGLVLRGELEVDQGGQRRRIGAGSGFYVPGGEPSHRFYAARRAVVAGFVPLEGRAAEEALPRSGPDGEVHVTPAEEKETPDTDESQLAPGEIRAEIIAMGPWALTQATFGPTSGYSNTYCDAPHWGIVVSGAAAIEFEDDIEVLGAGDFYHAPQGPPGHRLEVVDGAVIADFTPLDTLQAGVRLVEWREELRARIRAGPS